MFSVRCNIDKTDRINRAVIGFALCLAVLVGMGKLFFLILGLVLMLEGLIGWCSIPYFLSKIKAISIFNKFMKFYRSSSENRTQFHLFLAFLIIPLVGMTILYIWVKLFWI